MKVPDDIAIVAIDDLPHLDIFFPFNRRRSRRLRYGKESN